MLGHMTFEECAARWPRLVKAMQWTAILSSGEAGCALRDYRSARDGWGTPDLMRWGGGEAVVHYGGPIRVIREAIRQRHVVRAMTGQAAP